MIRFPGNFLWGAATSAYQVEGNNTRSDWWEWEHRIGSTQPSGQACCHYARYAEDFDLAQELGHKAHRFSIEWSRIEPEEGVFSEPELRHYRDVVLALRQRSIEPIVTLNHFTLPLWFSRRGGWLNKRAQKFFLRYVERVVERLGDQVRFWVTINEPCIYAYHAYIIGVWPPQQKSFQASGDVVKSLAEAHVLAYRRIHHIYRKKRWPEPSVSIAKNLQFFEPCVLTVRNRIAAYIRDRIFNQSLINTLARRNALDFIGVNYYTRSLVETRGWRMRNLLLDTCAGNHSRLRQNSLGWDIYPGGLYELLLRLKRCRLPVFILENGICTDDDQLRWEFIRQHLGILRQAMSEGVQVLGYIYWSLIDNFEWDKGFLPRFGLVEVDYQTYKRTVRESARKFALVCKTSILE